MKNPTVCNPHQPSASNTKTILPPDIAWPDSCVSQISIGIYLFDVHTTYLACLEIPPGQNFSVELDLQPVLWCAAQSQSARLAMGACAQGKPLELGVSWIAEIHIF